MAAITLFLAEASRDDAEHSRIIEIIGSTGAANKDHRVIILDLQVIEGNLRGDNTAK